MNPALEYIDKSPEPYRSIMLHLQVIIETHFPKLQLKYKWSLPFYYIGDKTMFCFLNYRKTFVDLGMTHAIKLSNKHQALVAGEGRKMLRSLRFKTVDDIDDEILIETLEELMLLRKSKIRK